MSVLVLNAGSSTLKATLLDPPDRTPLLQETLGWGADATAAPGRTEDLRNVVEAACARDSSSSLEVVGHRIVHGGPDFTAPVIVDDDVLDRLDDVSRLAPLHNPVAVETLRAARTLLPNVPHVACFDTAFHATLDEAAWRYPVPGAWTEDWGIRRYGFHGLSVDWATTRASALLGARGQALGLVVAHLGSGSSVTAVDAGRSVWTSMGYTPLEGLMMGTRAGSIDPGILLALLREGRRDATTLADELEHESGLLAVGGTADMRELAAASARDARAALAIEMYARRAAQAIAAAATSLRTLDAVVFTGGIGENAGSVRAAIARRLGPLGISSVGDREDDGALTPAGARPVVLRIEAREDVVIADAAAALARS